MQLVGTILYVYGTALADTITVTSASTLTVVLNGASAAFVSSAVTGINIYGYAGNDAISVNSLASGTALIADGGDNNDTLTIGSSVTEGTILIGGEGNDTLTGGAGNDVYVFDTDGALGSDTIIDSRGGTDTLDFSGTTTRSINIDLSRSSQVVNSALSLAFSSGTTMENVGGGSLSDTITGNTLANLLTGGAGDDIYIFDTDLAQGSDTINETGGGTDTLDFSGTTTRSITIDLSNAASQVVNAGLTLTLSSGATIENVIGTALNDTITGNSLANVLTGGTGNDTYLFDTDLALGSDTINEAGGGTDTLDFSGSTTRSIAINLSNAVAQVVNAGLSLNLSSGTTIENVIGTALNDKFTGNSLNNVLAGGAGNDFYLLDTDLAQGSDTINEAGGGTDTVDFSGTTTRSIAIDLSNATTQVVNGGLTLTLSSGTTIENVISGALSDTLTGNSLNNVLTGGAGDDTYLFNTNTALGSDNVVDTLGIDSLSFVGSTADVAVNLGLTTAQTVNSNLTLTLGSATALENLSGGLGDDTLIGNALNNTLSGGDGDDILTGGTGNDVLQGGDGKNILIGGSGADTLTGGTDEDLLIGGRYILESDAAALALIHAEWTSANSFNDRKAHLLGTLSGGANGSSTLRSTTVQEDAAKDTLTGGDGNDWYLLNSLGATLANRDIVTADIDSFFTDISTWL